MFGIYKFELQRIIKINEEIESLKNETLQKRIYASSHDDIELTLQCEKLLRECEKKIWEFNFFWNDVIKKNNIKLSETFYVNLNSFKCSQAKMAQYKVFLNTFSKMVNRYKLNKQGRVVK